jgi:hypothetical protein
VFVTASGTERSVGLLTPSTADVNLRTLCQVPVEVQGSISFRKKKDFLVFASRPTVAPTRCLVQLVKGENGRSLNVTVKFHLVSRLRMYRCIFGSPCSC